MNEYLPPIEALVHARNSGKGRPTLKQIDILTDLADEMLATLKAVEARMTATPAFNAWDLGPSPTLKRVRATIAKAEGRS